MTAVEPKVAGPGSAVPVPAIDPLPPEAAMRWPLGRRLISEFMGTAFLLATVVGSGIMATDLTGDPGIQLLVNAMATAAVLTALILALGPVSGAHLNPAVTLADRLLGQISTGAALGYVGVQVGGGIVGVVVANLMFDLPAVSMSTQTRAGGHLVLAEAVATLGLIVVIFVAVRAGQARFVAFVVGGYIGGAYFFTSSTSFANPAVTVGRTFSDTFTGIAPGSAPAFVAAQLLATGVAVVVVRVIFARQSDGASPGSP